MELTIQQTKKQYEAWSRLFDESTSYIGFGGGAGGGKTWLGCEWLLVVCNLYPGTRWFIGREELKRLKDSTLQTFYKVCSYHKVPQSLYVFKEQGSYIEFGNGSRIDLLDLKYLPSDPLYERYGSIEFTGGWIEEAGEVHFNAFDTLKSRLGRQLNDKYNILPKMLLTFNPKKNWLYHMFYKPWRDGTLEENLAFIQSLVDDNEYNEKRYKQQLIQLKDKVQKQRLLYGNWEYDDDPSALIDFEAISDLWTNTVDHDIKVMIVDVARLGKDKTVITLWLGKELTKVYIYKKQDTDVTRQKIREMAIAERIPFSRIVIDEDGVGGGIVDSLKGVRGFIGGSSPIPNKNDEKPNYRNLRTQCYYYLAECINTRKMAIRAEVISDEPSNFQDLLTEELEQIKEKNPDSDDKKLQIIPKEEIKEAIGRSPDFADCLMMRMLLDIEPVRPADIVGIQRVHQQRTRKYQFK